jgi:endo-1,4-beta-xylanase
LRDLAHYRGIVIGSAVQPGLIANNPTYADVLGGQFDMVTAENAMKWPAVHPDPNRYDFTAADSLVAFAQQRHMAVRGHNLLTGGTNTASWVLNGTFSRPQLTSIVRDHITTVVSHFRGQVVQWDVVNEAIDVTGQLEANVWQRGIGSDYIDKAFRWAHAADPHALLFYNEDDVACDVCSGRFPLTLEQHRDEAIYNLVAGMKQRGVPISGVGLQMHLWSSGPDPAYLAGFFDRLRRLGLQVAVTEMDVRLPDSHPVRDLGRQADVYASVLRSCLAAPNCKTFVVWGFSDATSWIPSYIPSFGTGDLYDADYQPKPAYFSVQRVLAGG